MLTRTKLMIASGLTVAALIPGLASAHTDLSIGLNLGAVAPVYTAPAPVAFGPAPTVVYQQPAPVVYEASPTVVYTAPAPVFYGGAVVYGHPYHRGYWEGGRYWR
jgi:hypothetical protein